ncbi:ABC transporter permease [Gleimia sp. 6138-11-ORH1]|uniref:ABC transporter permease n=1 Tax=Gleimia sp. 6138-11-ORH1 TaxID=2973937 RepID=UPI00216741C9|nr:ABC transporter permease [Gleimia sp. 6138-11-ORH1]MCS4484012.1 ABC transporter permease [Gleimia sp. 6138-11-ORH1]
MNTAVAFKYLKTLRRNPIDTFSMAVRPLFSVTLFAIFASTYIEGDTGVTFMVLSVALVNIIINSVQGSCYEARDDTSDSRSDIIILAPGGFHGFSAAQAIVQTAFASVQSLVVLLVSAPLLEIHYSGFALKIVLTGVVLLIVTSYLLSLFLVKISILYDNFLAVSFTIVVLVTLGGAFYPVDALPDWVRTIALLNPLTYLIDLCRTPFIGGQPLVNYSTSVLVCVGFILLLVAVNFVVRSRRFDLSNRSRF